MKRLIVVAMAASALALTAVPSQAATVHRASPANPSTNYAYQGNAYGTKVTIGNTVTSGASAPVVLACAADPGVHETNTTAGVTLPPLLGSGTVSTSADTLTSPVETKTAATVQNLSLLGGLVSATAIHSVSATSHRASGFQTSSAGTSFTSLEVAGVPITGVVNPNTTLDVPGFGHVVLNEQQASIGHRSASLTVNAIHLVITQSNALGIAVGTNVVVAHATSGLGGPVAATLDGFAYGSQVHVGHVVSSGASFRVTLPCLGTNGRVKTNDGAGISLPGVLQTGAIHNTASGTVDPSSASGETTSSVDSADLVSELVQATVIKADAHASSDGNNSTFSDSGSTFGTLSIEGFPGIGANVAPNTRLHIAGLGNLWLHRVINNGNSIEVRMIELVVNHSNSLGLAVGTDVRVAVAHASVH